MKKYIFLVLFLSGFLTISCKHQNAAPLKDNGNSIKEVNYDSWIENLGDKAPDENQLPEGFTLERVSAQYVTVKTTPELDLPIDDNSPIAKPHSVFIEREKIEPAMVHLISDNGTIIRSWVVDP